MNIPEAISEGHVYPGYKPLRWALEQSFVGNRYYRQRFAIVSAKTGEPVIIENTFISSAPAGPEEE